MPTTPTTGDIPLTRSDLLKISELLVAEAQTYSDRSKTDSDPRVHDINLATAQALNRVAASLIDHLRSLH